MKKSLFSTRSLVQGAIIAAVYVALTLSNAMFSYGMVQIRIAEALTILPLFTPAAIPGIFIGCLVANILSPSPNIIDIIFGSLTSLFAGSLTYQLGKMLADKMKEIPKFLIAIIPPILLNALIVGAYVQMLWYPSVPMYLVMISVGIGQVIACYGLGGILYFTLKKTKIDKLM